MTIRGVMLLLCATFMTSVFGLQLECIDNGDGTYSCVELVKSNGRSAIDTEDRSVDPTYLEQAKGVCRYRAPSRRVSGMASASAVRMEAKKAAQAEYNQCLIRKARELQNAERSGAD